MTLFIGTLIYIALTIIFVIGYTKLLKEILIREFNKKKGE